MNNQEILVSIIIPAFNAERYLNQTLESLATQTYRNLEIILVDDGSQDTTYEIACNFQKSNNKLKILRQKQNEGESSAINLGWVHAKGKFICVISHDDPQDVQWLTSMMNFIEINPGFILYYSDRIKINSKDQVISFDYLYDWSLQTLIGKMICIASTGTLIDKTMLPTNFLPRDTRLRQCSDLKQMLKLAQYGHSGIYIALQLVKWAFKQLQFSHAFYQVWLMRDSIKKLLFRSGRVLFLQTALVILINKVANTSHSWFGKIPRELSKNPCQN
jgi:glycosyltransferase involved in cell wall biosynthesis